MSTTSYTSGQQDFWISKLGLFNTDKEILKSEEQWLTDSIIHGAQLMIAEQAKDITGLQSPQCGRSATFKPISHRSKCLQILHMSGNHWILISNIMIHEDSSSVAVDSVFVYDSMRNTRVSKSLKNNACQLLKPQAKRVTFAVMNIMAQPNDNDCGIFAIANATAIANNIDPCSCMWQLKQMRPHLLSCIEAGRLTPFPYKKRRVSLGGKVLKNIREHIYCTCRMIYDKDIDMILCNRCQVWFHGSCVGVIVKSYPKEEQWVCSNCIQFVEEMAKQ